MERVMCLSCCPFPRLPAPSVVVADGFSGLDLVTTRALLAWIADSDCRAMVSIDEVDDSIEVIVSEFDVRRGCERLRC